MTHQIKSTSGDIQIAWNSDVCILVIDQTEKSVNSLTIAFLEDFMNVVAQILEYKSLKGLVIASGKKNCFCAGVDIGIFENWKTAADASAGSRTLQSILATIEKASVPVVAAIHGTCLGGGLELALSCSYRICSNDPKTKMGLPETRLGLIPGAGGTQRLPSIVGLVNSLDLILTGKQLDSKRATKMGLMDESVPITQLTSRAVDICLNKELAEQIELRRPKFGYLMKSAPMRAFVNWQSKKSIIKTTNGKYPAAFYALEAVMASFNAEGDSGYELESTLFGKCFDTEVHKSLVHIFRISTAAKKNPYSENVLTDADSIWMNPLKTGERPIGILGAGLMGSGIATVLSENKFRSVMLDNNKEGLARGVARINDHFMALVKKRRISQRERDFALNRVAPTLSIETLAGTNVVIEAVFEDLHIKHQMIAKCEKEISHDFIFATNTSSIPISQIAKSARKPELVVGMHFFSPVSKMPLVEIIRTEQTRPDVVAAAFNLATAMGKSIIVVNDGPGFFTTRVLAFLLAEAITLIAEGTPIEAVDNAMKKFGWPVGPIQLVDEVGIDVALHVMETMQTAFPDRMIKVSGFADFPKHGILGRKNGTGFYSYNKDKRQGVNQDVYKLLRHVESNKVASEQEIVDRCNYVFIIESMRCLNDGIIQSSDDGDLGTIFGLGFPPFLGGPFHHMRTFGEQCFSAKAKEQASQFGSRFNIDSLPQSMFLER